MKVYQMCLVLGKEKNYNQDGTLKNKTVSPKYAGEKELSDILEDNNWRKLGACSIECINVLDYETKKSDAIKKAEVNALIKANIDKSKKPKTALQISTEQNAALLKRIEALESNNTVDKSNERIMLELKASELELKFRSDITDAKLLEKIVSIEKDFKL